MSRPHNWSLLAAWVVEVMLLPLRFMFPRACSTCWSKGTSATVSMRSMNAFLLLQDALVQNMEPL